MASANFSDLLQAARDAGYSNCPPGTYDVKVISTEAKQTAKGKDMFVIKYEITTGPNAGRKVTNRMTISPESAAALGFFFREMRAMGLDETYFAKNPTVHQIAAELMGKTCQIVVATEQYNGEDRDVVKKIMPPVTGVSSPVMAATPQPVAPQSPAAVAPQRVADPTAPSVPF